MTQPSIYINANRLLVDTIGMSRDELGGLLLRLFSDLQGGSYGLVESCSFIDGFTKGTTHRPHIPNDVRRRVLSVGKCAGCQSSTNLTIDHIVPFSKGGIDDEENLQCLCAPCNRAKSDSIPTA